MIGKSEGREFRTANLHMEGCATEQGRAGRQGSISMFGHRWDEEAEKGNEVENDRERHVLEVEGE